jgi:hypothetical protein
LSIRLAAFRRALVSHQFFIKPNTIMKLDNTQLALINAGLAEADGGGQLSIDVHASQKDGWYAGATYTIKF